jgi:hypothetical protein
VGVRVARGCGFAAANCFVGTRDHFVRFLATFVYILNLQNPSSRVQNPSTSSIQAHLTYFLDRLPFIKIPMSSHPPHYISEQLGMISPKENYSDILSPSPGFSDVKRARQQEKDGEEEEARHPEEEEESPRQDLYFAVESWSAHAVGDLDFRLGQVITVSMCTEHFYFGSYETKQGVVKGGVFPKLCVAELPPEGVVQDGILVLMSPEEFTLELEPDMLLEEEDMCL